MSRWSKAEPPSDPPSLVLRSVEDTRVLKREVPKLSADKVLHIIDSGPHLLQGDAKRLFDASRDNYG